MVVKSLCIWLSPFWLLLPQVPKLPVSVAHVWVNSACLCLFLSSRWILIHLLKSNHVLHPVPSEILPTFPRQGWPLHPLSSIVILPYLRLHTTHVLLQGVCVHRCPVSESSKQDRDEFWGLSLNAQHLATFPNCSLAAAQVRRATSRRIRTCIQFLIWQLFIDLIYVTHWGHHSQQDSSGVFLGHLRIRKGALWIVVFPRPQFYQRLDFFFFCSSHVRHVPCLKKKLLSFTFLIYTQWTRQIL